MDEVGLIEGSTKPELRDSEAPTDRVLWAIEEPAVTAGGWAAAGGCDAQEADIWCVERGETRTGGLRYQSAAGNWSINATVHLQNK